MKMLHQLWGAALLLLAAAAQPAAAQSSGGAPVVLQGATVRTLQAADGQSYRLYLSIPQQEPPPEGFPVLYLLDANGYFPLLATAARLQSRRPDVTGVVPMVVAGIDHDAGEAFDIDRRYRDFTPPTRDGGPPKLIEAFKIQPPCCEADRFLAFIEAEVKPLVEKLAPVDRGKQSLFGHSLGGLLALHALAARPEAFQNVIAVSPSAWWDDQRVLDGLRAFASGDKAGLARSLVIVGAREHLDMRQGAAAAAEVLKAGRASGPLTRFEETRYADHGTVVPVAINRALRFASGAEPWPAEKAD
ncbi:MAG TPA: alpha/beta hydrolase-fold protein [Azospirillaceae bacterium]|nr:alpha/beta hydrolase-fold protein [Azospirillaceae bacterium]